MNKGINLSKGEWLFFLGTDDLFFNDAVLEKTSSFFNDIENKLLFGSVSYEVEKYQPFIYNKNKTLKQPQWNWRIWIYNTVHHQATFYKRSLFEEYNFDFNYKVLADYAMNIYLYQKKIPFKIIDTTISKCSSSGTSKSGIWSLYKEEVQIKKNASLYIWSPFFYVIAFIKFSVRKIQDGRK